MKGHEYWRLERDICCAMLSSGSSSNAGAKGFTIEQVHQACGAKSFDYRVWPDQNDVDELQSSTVILVPWMVTVKFMSLGIFISMSISFSSASVSGVFRWRSTGRRGHILIPGWSKLLWGLFVLCKFFLLLVCKGWAQTVGKPHHYKLEPPRLYFQQFMQYWKLSYKKILLPLLVGNSRDCIIPALPILDQNTTVFPLDVVLSLQHCGLELMERSPLNLSVLSMTEF